MPVASTRRCPTLRVHLVVLAAASVLATSSVGAQNGDGGSSEPWRIIQPAQSTLVFARDGSLIGEIGEQWRTSVSIRTLPRYVPQAFVAIEDHRFYQHDGVDVVGIAGALRDMVRGQPRGASTITQQLVGNMHPEAIDRTDRSLSRKLREQAAAREMEKHYSKEQILEAYLNQISFGHGWFGVESAARHYFGKPATRLTLVEAATLAALPKGPALYDPIRHADRALARRNLVLDRMVEEKYITAAAAEEAKRQPITTASNAGMSAYAPYFVDLVRQRAEREGIPLGNGGYRVYTTVDPLLQRTATEAVREGLARVEARPGYRHRTYAQRTRGRSDYLQGMAVMLDAASGDVLAMVGGRDYAESQFNRAVLALRQPGSAFKPVVYAAALRDSMSASHFVADTALAILLENGTVYSPENSDGLFLGEMTLREALARSRNPVAVAIGQHVGMDSVIALARRLGIETPIAPFPSSAIGASAVRPLDFVAAFTSFANLGARAEPRFIVKIEDRAGRVVHNPPKKAPHFALDPRVAFIVRDMMRDVVERGTATQVRRNVPAHVPVAGKTGTTNDNTDVWFVGMTPEIVGGVWLGFDTPKMIMPGAAGGSLAAPIWGDIVGRYYQDRPSGSWEPPAGIVVAELDRATATLADELTPPEQRYTEYFIEGTEPAQLRFDPWTVFKWGPIN